MRPKSKKDPNNTRKYSDALASMQNLISRISPSVFRRRDNTDKDNAEIISKTLEKMKKDKLVEVFVDKLRRISLVGPVVRFNDSGYRSDHKGRMKGIIFPEGIYNAIVLFHMMCLVILLFLSSFSGFLIKFQEPHSTSLLVLLLKIMCLLAVLARILMKSLNQFNDKGKRKKYIKDILKAYSSKPTFIIDIASLVLLILFITRPQIMNVARIYFVILVLQLLSTSKELVRFEVTYLSTEKKRYMVSLIQVFIFNILFAHVMASILIAMSLLRPQNNWIQKYGIEDGSWWSIYVHAFYWATTTMMTVGYGDITPANQTEVFITSFVEIISCIILSYNISVIGDILRVIRKSDENIRRKMAIFERMTRAGKKKSRRHSSAFGEAVFNKKREEDGQEPTYIDPDLEQRIFTYIRELNIDDQGYKFKERSTFLQELPESLRREFYQQANKIIFPSVTFFNHLKPITLEKLAEDISSNFHHPDELINAEGEIYILEKGKVGLTYRRKGSSINGEIMQQVKVKEADDNLLITNWFLYFSKPQKYGLKSLEYSLSWSIKTERLMEVLMQSKIDCQHYFSVLHKHIIDENEWEILKCSYCKKKYHTVFDCSRLTYMPLRSLSIDKDKANLGRDQPRQDYTRKRSSIPRVSALKFRKNFYKVVEKFTIEANTMDVLDEEALFREKANLIEKELLDENKAKYGEGEGGSFIFSLKEEKFKRMMLDAIREYDTGYQEEFWPLETDKATNFEFYFPGDNSNKFVVTPVGKVGRKQTEKRRKMVAEKMEKLRKLQYNHLN